MSKRIIVGVTGASGAIYAHTLIKTLVALQAEVQLIFTQAGSQVYAYETACQPEDWSDGVRLWDNEDLFSPLASGSYPFDALVVIPCSMNTLGSLASGTGDRLLTRVAQVALKEHRQLIVVPREMPFNVIHLENMLRLARAGAVMMAAAPGFYHLPQGLDDLVGHVVGKVLDQLNIEHQMYKRWEGRRSS
ncbi:MAG: UbiX family flavin prenyltransferase [Peptococcaceae bacterium]|jgi:4-hydroxy-3-polyprenylbenzoate decarboxylase|nr:UbiX family flavin prenyltransferase [Peptococcaceae bacterium]